ncbi:unnamed protein product [Alternaria alternata]
MAERAREEFMDRIKALRLSGEYSDLTITCGPDTYKVHKAIVCSQSSFFSKAEKFPVCKEATEGGIHLLEDDPHAVKLLIQFFYESEYDPLLPSPDRYDLDEAGKPKLTVLKEHGYHYDFPHTCKSDCPDPAYRCVNFICKHCTKVRPPDGDADQLLLHAMMYELADKYDVTGLRYLAKKKFYRSCAAFWDTEQFAIAAEHALISTPESDTGLRQSLCQTIRSHIKLLNVPSVVTLLHKHPDLMYSVLRKQAEELGGLEPKAKTAS